ncbi:hypothetical protein RI845_07390 [Thalassotalea nanhaiensis]|uniref:Endonuclease/exonuclease/phosphatase family protein n=1 Tax=Thalassotalea nanhaiensis TaxID=3065648 RepID=A0ABY9TNH8_9GAMM|nr:hypothetical protein RI845_07390 [Colwelliaceae bacterium SQ345]
MELKITSWNIEHSARLIGTNISDLNKDRRKRVVDTIQDINPDILCMLEAPSSEEDIKAFCNDVLDNKWQPITLNNDDYQIKGTQWIWFLVRDSLFNNCRLQAPSIWQSFVGHKSWPVHYWGQEKEKSHSHYRHPQVLIFTTQNGQELEVIGQHMKSKINRNPVWEDKEEGILTTKYINEALKARIKLATEARNIRAYINTRFDQNQSPAIVVLGDANDGIGQDYFEKKYMFFDLISNLQGNVMQSDRFFNHALFDYPENLRWSAKYANPITGKKAKDNPLLIDHIIMSQALVNGSFDLQAGEGAGEVEHLAFERGNSGASAKRITSDHRPVSITLKG